MIKYFFAILLGLASYHAQAQPSWMEQVPAAMQVQHSPVKVEDYLDSARQATYLPVHARHFSIQKESVSPYRSGNDYYWRLPAKGFAIRVYLRTIIAPGDTLYLHDANGMIIEKRYHQNHQGTLWASTMYPQEVSLRYRVHSGQVPELQIENYSLKPIPERLKSVSDFGDADFCEINVNCSEGSSYREVQQSVLRINVVLGGLEYWCTGTLINNTALNFIPYILTAEHCGLTGSNQIASAGDLDKWQFFFNYSGNGCENPNSENEVNFTSITGSEFISRSDDNGGDFGSDFLLLKLTDTTSFNQLNRPYFAGWNRADSKPMRGVSIHHPDGDIKKISTYTSPAKSSEFTPNAQDTHWEVVWAATVNGHGVTEGGSSGCPLLDADGLMRGVLTGGLATCFANTDPDYYGKFSYSWTENGSAPDRQLRPWLDPANSGVFILPGIYKGDSLPQNPNPSEEVVLVPNPVINGLLMIDGLAADEQVDLQVFTLGGKLVHLEKDITGQPAGFNRPEINIESLANGLYLVRIVGGRETSLQKIIIDR